MVLSHRSAVVSIDPREVPDIVSQTFLLQYVQVATVTVLLYDAIITMDKEVKYFWNTSWWRGVNAIFFMNRYVGFFGAIAYIYWDLYGVTQMLCRFSGWSQNIANSFTVVLIDYILMIRVLALYSRGRRLTICLWILLFLEAAVKFGTSIYITYTQHIVIGLLAEDITVCGADVLPPWQLGIFGWVAPLAYSVFLLILALYKATEYWKMSAGFRGFALVKVLVYDQILYFSFVLVCSVAEIVQYRIAGSYDFQGILLQALGNPALLCVLGSRMLINLKEAGELGVNEGTNYRHPFQTMSEMKFAGRQK